MLTCVFSGICIWWTRGRYRRLQPYVIAALMVVLVFLAITVLFAVNPFATLPSGAPPDGRGLNYQLRNFYMIVHPPALYVGFTSAAVPFALAVAALITGRLDNAWVAANRINESGEVMAPNERASLDAALRAITTNAALVIGLEDEVGSLRWGKKADFTVLEADPYEVGAGDLRDIPLWGTVFEGEKFPF